MRQRESVTIARELGKRGKQAKRYEKKKLYILSIILATKNKTIINIPGKVAILSIIKYSVRHILHKGSGKKI